MSKRPEISELEEITRMEGEGQANMQSWKHKEAQQVKESSQQGSSFSKSQQDQVLNAPAGLDLQEALHFQKQTNTTLGSKEVPSTFYPPEPEKTKNQTYQENLPIGEPRRFGN